MEIRRGRPRRSADSRNVIGSYRLLGYGGNDLCERCSQRADEARVLPDAQDVTPAAKAPPRLAELLRRAALAADT